MRSRAGAGRAAPVPLDVVGPGRGGREAALRRALAGLSAAGIRHAVIGGVALAACGIERTTGALDVLVDPAHLARAGLVLGRAGFRPRPKRGARGRHVEPGSAAELFLIEAGDGIDDSILAAATPARLLGTSAPTALLDHLAVLAFRSRAARHRDDWLAIVRSDRTDLRVAEALLAAVQPGYLVAWKSRLRAALRGVEPAGGRRHRPAPAAADPRA